MENNNKKKTSPADLDKRIQLLDQQFASGELTEAQYWRRFAEMIGFQRSPISMQDFQHLKEAYKVILNP